MDLVDARKIAEIVSKADGGCPNCVEALVEQLKEKFPSIDWMTLMYMIDPDWEPKNAS